MSAIGRCNAPVPQTRKSLQPERLTSPVSTVLYKTGQQLELANCDAHINQETANVVEKCVSKVKRKRPFLPAVMEASSCSVQR